MPEDIEALSNWQALPETNRAAFEALIDQCMDDPEYSATMKVISVIMREDQP